MNKKKLLKALLDELYMHHDSGNIYLSLTPKSPNYKVIKDFIKGGETHDNN
ncbi:MAG: hypothetical protein J1F32_01635 [Erysipelotrichales bacterium]|nr:hypothetical protein [Erysipelotrichales bacterium]